MWLLLLVCGLIHVQARNYNYEDYVRCSIWGTSHVFNYANRGYELKDQCTVVLSTTNCSYTASYNQLIPFSIELERDSNSFNVLAVSLSIKIYGVHYKILRERVVLVNDQLVNVPYQGFNDISITFYGNKLVFSSLIFEVDWDGYENVEIYMYKNYENYLCGVCSGDYTPDSLSYDPNYLSAKNCDFSLNYASNCDKSRYRAADYCGLIKKKDSPWKNYISKLNKDFIDYIYESCVTDMCNYEYDSYVQTYMKCQNFQTLSQACYAYGNYDFDWRSVSGCGMKCSSDKTYGIYRERPKTCMHPTNSYSQSLVYREGCYCKKGQVLDSNENCVYLNDCGCKMHDGSQMVDIGHSYYNQDCSLVYECRSSNANVYTSNYSCPSGFVCGLNRNRQRACVEQKIAIPSIEPPAVVIREAPEAIPLIDTPIVYETPMTTPIPTVEESSIAELIKSTISSYLNNFILQYFYLPGKMRSIDVFNGTCNQLTGENCINIQESSFTTPSQVIIESTTTSSFIPFTIETTPFIELTTQTETSTTSTTTETTKPLETSRRPRRPKVSYPQQQPQFISTSVARPSGIDLLNLLRGSQATTLTATLSNLNLFPGLQTPSNDLASLLGLTTTPAFDINSLLSLLQATTVTATLSNLDVFQTLTTQSPLAGFPNIQSFGQYNYNYGATQTATLPNLNTLPSIFTTPNIYGYNYGNQFNQGPIQTATLSGSNILPSLFTTPSNILNNFGSLYGQQQGPIQTATLSNLDLLNLLTTTPNIFNGIQSQPSNLLNLFGTMGAPSSFGSPGNNIGYNYNKYNDFDDNYDDNNDDPYY